jgi:hypothetical protein
MPTGPRCSISMMLLMVLAALGPAQVRRPAPPDEYDVTLRFTLRLPLPEWYDRFDEMLADLRRLGFQRPQLPPDGVEDPTNDRLQGRISSRNARKLLTHRSVETLLLQPKGFTPEAGRPVKIRVELATGLPREQQRALHRQVAEKLNRLGFQEAPGYFHEGFTMLLGTIDAARLSDLLPDLRRIPGGWLVPEEPVSTLPLPLRQRVPIRVVEVLPEPADFPPPATPPAPTMFPPEQAHWVKIEPALLALTGPQADETRTLRVEVILNRAPPEGDTAWERLLRGTASSVRVEGLVGQIATVTVKAPQATELARPSSVIHVRLPRTGQTETPPISKRPSDPWLETRLRRFHQSGHQGQGIKIAVVAADFRGYESYLGRGLPASTRYLDLTIPRNIDVRPDPVVPIEGLGQGTLMALTVAAAAPRADLVLIRVDPDTPYQLLTVARLINDVDFLPLVMEDRFNELTMDRAGLDLARARAVEERRNALKYLEFDVGDPRVPEIKKRAQESQERLKRAEEALAEIARREKELRERTDRYLSFRESLSMLRGTRVVVNALVWDSGWPIDAASGLSRYLDEKFVGDPGVPTVSRIRSVRQGVGTIWMQAASDRRGQFWTGLFRDADENGKMEFVSEHASLPPGRWSNELNFLGWQPHEGSATSALPTGIRVRVSLQWREPHEVRLEDSADDPYLEPISQLRLVILRQRDPSGTKVGNDEMEVIAHSQGKPVRLHQDRYTGTYEIASEFDVPTDGHYAVRVEGSVAKSLRPTSDQGNVNEAIVEIRPRLFVELTDPQGRARGRVFFSDFSDAVADLPAQGHGGHSGGGMGMPADAHHVLTVAADDPSSSYGAGPNRILAVKPDVLGPAVVPLPDGKSAQGSWGAAAFNAGLVACTLSVQAVPKPDVLLRRLHAAPGSRLVIPESWLRKP